MQEGDHDAVRALGLRGAPRLAAGAIVRRAASLPSIGTHAAAGMPKTMSREISGSGRAQNSEYMSGMRSRASSITSSNPALVNSASCAPLRWMIVLMPTVVP